GLHFEIRAHRTVGPNNANDIGARLFAETKVQNRSGDRLLLNEQSRSDFDLAADAERINALISGRLHRPRPNDLPVIVFASCIYRLDWPLARDSEKVGPAVGIDICGVEDPLH